MMNKPLDCLTQVKKLFANLENGDNQAMWLCCHMLRLDMAQFLLNDMEISEDAQQALMASAQRIVDGYPLQYALGETQFMGLDFFCEENVLIPRNDTEVMTELAIGHIGRKPMTVLDLCCGTGCIGLSIKYYCPDAKVTLGDISPHALALAKKNAQAIGVSVDVVETDMFSQLSGAFDVIVSNPPYIPSDVIPTLSPQVQHEPVLALDGSADGLHFYRRIEQDYRRFLMEDGVLFLEMGHDQGQQLLRLFKAGQVFKDYQGRDRILKLEK